MIELVAAEIEAADQCANRAIFRAGRYERRFHLGQLVDAPRLGLLDHVGDGTVIDDAAIGFRNGVIDFVGHSYGVKAAYDSTIVAEGHHIYPGLILPDNSLGLHEVDLVRATATEAAPASITAAAFSSVMPPMATVGRPRAAPARDASITT